MKYLKLFLCSALFTIIHSCNQQQSATAEEDLRTPPAGYESLSDCRHAESRYRVWAESKDSIYGFKIRALMVSWINDSTLTSTTTFELCHRSGRKFTLEGEGVSMLSFEDFRNFVNNNHRMHNDTIVDFCYEYEFPHTDVFYMESCNGRPFLFLDVTFDGRKALLIRKGPKELCNYYRIFSLGKHYETLTEIIYEPYNQFKTSIGHFTSGASTMIDYVGRTIKVYTHVPGSCSCHSNVIIDTYTLNREQGKFIKTTQEIVHQDEE